MKTDPVVSHCSELLRLDLMLTPEEIKAGKVSTLSGQSISLLADGVLPPGYLVGRYFDCRQSGEGRRLMSHTQEVFVMNTRNHNVR